MGWVVMSERELNRVDVLAQVDDARLSIDTAANMVDLTRRQIFRLLERYRQDGAAAIRHRSRGRTPNTQMRGYMLALVKESTACFRADIGRGDAGRTPRLQGVAGDAAQLDG